MTHNDCENKLELDLDDEEASVRFGSQLATRLTAPLVLTFSGDLGAGKTTIIRAMLKQLGVKSAIKSPTFSLVESYDCQSMQIHHFDLYRIHQADELDYMGFRDYFTEQSLCCIEWPEHAGNQLLDVDLGVKLMSKGAGRHVQIVALSVAGERILTGLVGES